jgi:phage gpG-like protein
MEYEITEEGAGHVAALLSAGAVQARDTQVVMEKIALDMMRVEKIVFRSQGRRGGGSWAALAPDTVRKKGIGGYNILRTDLAKPGYSKIGGVVSSDTLYRSLTTPGAPYQILRITKDTALLGTDRPYAETQQHGSWLRSIPARPFIQILATDVDRWKGLIAEHLMTPFIRSDPAERGIK